MTIEANLHDGGLSASDVANLKRPRVPEARPDLSALTLLSGCEITNTGPSTASCA